ncbi:MAG: hypothetical protein EBS66_18030 [Betaproteobacteria bacterium]|nr:hypothetical protein [Betaproteobacteria bacterium]
MHLIPPNKPPFNRRLVLLSGVYEQKSSIFIKQFFSSIELHIASILPAPASCIFIFFVTSSVLLFFFFSFFFFFLFLLYFFFYKFSNFCKVFSKKIVRVS